MISCVEAGTKRQPRHKPPTGYRLQISTPMDRNNLAVADVIQNWLTARGLYR